MFDCDWRSPAVFQKKPTLCVMKYTRKRRYIKRRRIARKKRESHNCLHRRCCYHRDQDEMDSVINDMANMRIGLETEPDLVDFSCCRFEIDIPVIFHLIDPVLKSKSNIEWAKHIEDKIIPVLNTDFNKNRENFSSTMKNQINSICSKADPIKKKYFENLPDILPHNTHVTWRYKLDRVIINPKTNVSISDMSNESIYKMVPAIDPESNLNIIVASSKNVLGISVFPFVDRDPNDSSKIDDQFKYRNSVLMATSVFIGNRPPYNLFRTFTHEIGHWCGLLHPFDNFTSKTMDIIRYGLNSLEISSDSPIIDSDSTGDLISDTAPQEKPTFGQVRDMIKPIDKQKIKHYGTHAWIFEDNERYSNFFNFMDYTDDIQLLMFTNVQMIRMVYYIKRFRPNFIKIIKLDEE